MKINLSSVKDAFIIAEATKRIKVLMEKQHGVKVKYGTFTWKIHDGKTVGVDYEVKNRCNFLLPEIMSGGAHA